MYKMIPFDEAKEKLIADLKSRSHGDEAIAVLTKNDSVLAIKRNRWDRIMDGYIIDPDPEHYGSMSIYKIFPTDKDLDMIQLPDFLLEKI